MRGEEAGAAPEVEDAVPFLGVEEGEEAGGEGGDEGGGEGVGLELGTLEGGFALGDEQGGDREVGWG